MGVLQKARQTDVIGNSLTLLVQKAEADSQPGV